MLTIKGAAPAKAIVSAQHGEFLKALTASKIAFDFPSEQDLSNFLDESKKDFQEARYKFETPGFQRLFSPIKDVSMVENWGENYWTIDISVATKHGDLPIRLFTSASRHILDSFRIDQKMPHRAKEKNTLVRDGDLYKDCMREYFRMIKADLMKRGYCYRYTPAIYNKTEIQGKIAIEFDGNPLSENPDVKTNEFHVFPTSGPEVRVLNKPEEFDALITFLLWYYRTDQLGQQSLGFNTLMKIKKDQGESESGRKNYQKTVSKYKARAATAQKGFTILKDQFKLNLGKVDYKKKDIESLKLDKTIIGKCIFPAKVTVELMSDLGVIPAVKTIGRNRVSDTSALKPNNPYKAPKDEAVGTVYFKTHKAEVKSKLKHIPWTVVAWALNGKLQKTENDYIVMFNNFDVDKAKEANRLTVDSVLRQEKKDVVTTAVDTSGELHETINGTIKLYQQAINSGVDILVDVRVP